MMSKQSLRGSQTMPQLHYTREDIQEQYQRVKLPEVASKSATGSAGASGKKRARSSGPRRHASSPASSDEEGGESSCEAENNEDSSRGRFSSRRSSRKRRRRARSAALFSACFHMLTPATTSATPSAGRSQRRSILAHLGLGGQRSPQQQQRPLSSSQTAGNLQQVCGPDGRTGTPTQRKHVSFGSGGGNGTQRRPSADCPASGQPIPVTAVNCSTGTASQQPQLPQQRQPESNEDAGRGNNVIMRNYRAHQPLAAQERKEAASNSKSGEGGCSGAVSAAQTAIANKQSPIYLVSSSSGSTLHQSPMQQQHLAASNQQIHSQAQVLPANQQAQVQRPQQMQMQPQFQQQQQQQQRGLFHPAVGAAQPVAAFRASPSAVICQQQAHHQVPSPMAQHPANTVYKRLPTVPMRTQATQTEITAYHLMATPSHSSGSPRTRPVAGSDTPSSAAVSETHAMSVGPFKQQQSTLQAQSRLPTEEQILSSISKSSPPPTPPPPTQRQLPDDGSDEWSVDEDEGVAGPDECGNLNAATLASCSSRSSSSASLEGHDSTLANTLQLVANTSSALEATAPETMTVTSASIIVPEEPKAKLENDNKREPTTSVSERGVASAIVEPLPPPPPPPQPSKSEKAPTADIEPPGQFKDGSAVLVSSTSSSSSATVDLFMNMNAPQAARPDSPEALSEEAELSAATATASIVERAPSPPSLSEASSQTDAALAPFIRKLGRRLLSMPSAESASPPIAPVPSSSTTSGAICRNRQQRHSSGNVIRSSELSCQPKDLNADKTAAATNESPSQLALCPCESTALIAQATSLVAGQTAIATADEHDDVDDDSWIAKEGEADEEEENTKPTTGAELSTSLAVLPSPQHTNRWPQTTTTTSLEESCAQSDKIIMDNGDRNSPSSSNTLATDENDFLAGAVANVATTPITTNSNLVSQRRDDFLQLASEDNPASELLASNELLAYELVQDELANVELATSEELVTGTKRSTTSTLSTRHHSYCSTDDFHSASHHNDNNNNNREAVAAVGRSCELVLEPTVGGGCSIISSSAQRRSIAQEEIREVLADSSEVELSGSERPVLLVETLSSPLDSATPDAANGPNRIALRQDSLKSVAVAATSTKTTIKADCEASGRFMIADGHKNLDERQDVEWNSSRTAAAAAEKTPHEFADSLSSQVLAEATLELAAELEEQSAVETQQQIEPQLHSQSQLQQQHQRDSSVSSSWSGSERPVIVSAIDASPPTTVSELDQDEELSMPSFVDSYRQRLEQSVQQLADSLLDSVLTECLTNTVAAANNNDINDSNVACRQQRPLEELSSSDSSQSTSTTSADGRSYTCCHPKPAAPIRRPPPLPEKPAHLRPVRMESAAAVAVTTTSIAAAALLHQGYQPVGVAHQAATPLTTTRAAEQSSENPLQVCSAQVQQSFEQLPEAQLELENSPPTPEVVSSTTPEPNITLTPSSSNGSALVSRSDSAASVVLGGACRAEPDRQSSGEPTEGARMGAELTRTTVSEATSSSPTTSSSSSSTSNCSSACELTTGNSKTISDHSHLQQQQQQQQVDLSLSAAVDDAAPEQVEGDRLLQLEDAAARSSDVSPMRVVSEQQRQRVKGAILTLAKQQLEEDPIELSSDVAICGNNNNNNNNNNTRRASQELSTVSEVSEEMSAAAAAAAGKLADGGQVEEALDALAERAPDATSSASALPPPLDKQQVASATLSQQPPQPPTLLLLQQQQQPQPTSGACGLGELGTTTEQDLAQSEYSLRSQSSDVGALLSEATQEVEAAAAVAAEVDEASLVSELLPQPAPQQQQSSGEILLPTCDRTSPPGGKSSTSSLVEQREAVGSSETKSAQRTRQASLVTTPLSSAPEEQRRRSVGSLVTSAAATVASNSNSTTTSTTGSHRHKAAAVDCPYVRDILPLSPDSRTVSPPNAALMGVAAGGGGHPKRLSHDDTMEAIEDDIEGEEQELAASGATDRSVPQLAPPVPAPFGHSDSCERAYTPAESIKEEEEEEEPSEAEEESSISVSQQHGLVISQETPQPASSAVVRQTSSATNSTSTEPQMASLSERQRSQTIAETCAAVVAQEDLDDEKADSAAAKLEAQQATSVSERKQLAQQAKSMSSESATSAILAHLSRHHHQELTLDEPSPTPSLEPSRSVDPAQRRESWRRESSLSRQPAAAVAATSTLSAGSCDEPTDISVSTTGTMKRKPRSSTSTEQQETSANPTQQQQQQRQLSSAGEQQVSNRQVSASLPTDSSICSSCSCLEATCSEQPASQTQVTTAKIPLPTAGTSASSPSTSLDNRKAAWISQEEGTVFTENYWLAHWLYISEHEESEIWRRAIDMNPPPPETVPSEHTGASGSGSSTFERLETASTNSERSFSTKYKSTTRKMIHRRATIEMYRRIISDTLKCEKRVEISRSNGEFGFRIHGSRPVVVSAIERGTSAETCGLQVGDLIYAINGTNILDMAHSDVVKLAHSADSSALVLDLVPTNGFLRMSKYSRTSNKQYEPTVTGFLLRLSPSTAQPLLIELQERMANVTGVSSQQRANKVNEVMRLAWRQRYYVLRSDNCLYWYKSPTDIEPHGGLNLQGFSASLTNEFSEPSYVIRLVRYGGQPHYLGTNNICDIQTWVDAINKAATEANQDDPYMKRTLTLARSRPSQIPEPDCCGYLHKFSHKRGGGAHWRPAYLVLKDACLYLFRDQQAELVEQASAVYYLHGYRIRAKHIEHKKYTFELIPPNRKTIRPMFLMASSEIDRKRWIAAFEYSIDRWIEID